MKRQVKRKKITKELMKLSKHTHPISTKEIIGEIRKDRRRHKRKVKTIFDYAGTLPKLDISIDEAIEKAIEIVAREKGKD